MSSAATAYNTPTARGGVDDDDAEATNGSLRGGVDDDDADSVCSLVA
jgi:hypothetical protein